MALWFNSGSTLNAAKEFAMGEYEEMCESMGLSAGSEEDYDRLTHAMLTGERPTLRRTFHDAPPVLKERLFSTYDEASDWSKKNHGRPFARTADGLHFTPAGNDLAKPPSQQGGNLEPPSEAQLRYAALKEWRTRVARERGVPAYLIFHDATLAAIATNAPQNLAALRKVATIGEKRLQAYGDEVIRVVQEVSGI